MIKQPMNTYSLSGKLGTAPFVVPVLAAIATVILSVVYAYIDLYSPIAGYISLLLVACLAVGIGRAVSFAGYLAKCRSMTFMRVAGVCAGVFGLYLSWAVFEYAFLRRYAPEVNVALMDLTASPDRVWSLAGLIAEDGWYTVMGVTPKGGMLWTFCGIEALVIVAGSTFFATHDIEGKLYCEGCRSWCSSSRKSSHLEVPNSQEACASVARGDIDALETLATVSQSDPHLHLDILRCPTCRYTAAYRVDLVREELDEDGNAKTEVTPLTGLINLTHESRQRVEAIADRPRDSEVAVQPRDMATDLVF